MKICICIFQDGNSSLHYAVYDNSVRCVEVLLKWGADLSQENENGETVMDMAINMKHREGRAGFKRI